MSTAYLSTAYLAPLRYYCILYSYDTIHIETAEHYVKQTYRNRCHIAGANGIVTLTVPVEKPGSPKCYTRDILVSNHGNWRHIHWNALTSAYRTTPFFEYYKDDFRPFYEKKYRFLIEYNNALQELICGLLDIDVNIKYTSQYTENTDSDFRNSISPKNKGADDSFRSPQYYQVFKDRNGFIPNLSIVDLLFNMGPESVLYLAQHNSAK
jgi:hypothetical protein